MSVCCLCSHVFTGTQSTSSAGSDSRLRLWDIESGCNISVSFEAMRLQTNKAIQLALSQDSSTVFVPSMSNVKVLSALKFFYFAPLGFEKEKGKGFLIIP